MTASRMDDEGVADEHVTLRLSVPDMDCPSCAGKVANALSDVDGVATTDLRPTSGTVTVTYAADRANEQDVVTTVESAGYEVVERSDGTDVSGSGVADSADVWTSPRAIKTWIGAVFLVVGLALTFVLTGLNTTLVSTTAVTLTVADAALLAATAAAGVPVVRSGYYSARNRSLDIDLLMGTAIVAATGIGLYIEAATLAVLFSIAELLERYAMDQTRDELRELLELSPEEATVFRNDDGGEPQEVVIPAEDVRVGERVIVRPGEKIPIDGTVVEGSSSVDQSPITGESVPVDKSGGDEVFAGTLNKAGYLEIETTSEAGETTLARIIDLVDDAQAKQTEKEQFVDRFASYYTPVVVVLALLTAFLPPLIIDGTATIGLAGLEHTFGDDSLVWFVRGLTLLVIACPCAFVISTPVSVASGVTSAARNGVLIKGGNHLEAMGEVDAVAFDKTGTLTAGELTVTDVLGIGENSPEDVLARAAALEGRSEHPIAEAVLERANGAGIEPRAVTAFESLTGKGVRGDIDGTAYYAGKPGLFEELGFDLDRSAAGPQRTDGGVSAVGEDALPGGQDVSDTDSPSLRSRIDALQAEGKTVILVGTDQRLFGAIAIADEIRPEARLAVDALHRLGVGPLVMLTGDNEGTARAVAEELGIGEYRAGLLPAEKVEAVEELQDEYGSVAMVGDGINDAPALATADVGIAMGAAGTDTAIETADIALMGDNVAKLPYLYALAQRANSVIRQNIWSSLGVKALLAIGVPFGYVSVAVAVIVGDMGMSLGVTGNAMRLSRVTPEEFIEE
ncbi:heavy metal translocating P-type ATPase [Natranaeroarchaeum aerophilus]|uniref:Cation-translocating P-type ATPase n=1 Tax=Natranaeroarchaeum aerophilus TaxID=2917711 RepID=A0AAE3FRB6_9EURY|nr:cation-translocating P-type ATPase [Natranaeroarchaeum aerophilus]MCL9813726.1 cation-translocating P-type ATPase [Natranaeroarchaeum aerophilus]